MKKKVISILLAASMVLSLAACGSTRTDETNTTTDAEPVSDEPASDEAANDSAGGEKVFTLPTFYVGENVGAVYFEPAVERFNEQNAGVYKVELEEVVESGYSDKIIQLAQAGRIPALVHTVPDVLVDGGYFADMTDFLNENPEIKALCLDGSIDYCTQDDGTIISVPICHLANMGTFYNTEMYNPDKNIVDMSVDEFLESLGDNKIAFSTAENAWCSVLFFTALIANEEGGAELLNAYDGGELTDFNQAPILNAATKFQQIFTQYADASSVGAAFADSANAFFSGSAAVISNGSWMNADFSANNSDKWSENFDGANVKADYFPGNVAVASSISGYGGWALTTGGTEDEQEAAKAFLAFLYSQDELEQYALIEGKQIPNMDYSDEFLAKLDATPLVKAQTELISEGTILVPNFGGIMVDSISGEVFGTILVQLVTGSITPEEFCNQLTTKSKEALAE